MYFALLVGIGEVRAKQGTAAHGALNVEQGCFSLALIELLLFLFPLWSVFHADILGM